jgi:WD40 repeat protein
LLVSGGAEGSIFLWDVQSGAQARHLRAHTLTARIVRFSPDGRFLMSGGFDQRALLWEVAPLETRGRIEEENHDLYIPTAAPDGTYLAAGRTDGSVIVWNGKTGERIWRFQAGNELIWTLGFTPDSELLVTASDRIRIWNLKDGRLMREFELSMRVEEVVSALSISSQHIFAAYEGTDEWTGGVIAWNIETGAEVQRFTAPLGAQGVILSPDQRLIATYTIADYQARVFDVTTGQELYVFPMENNFASALAFSPDNKVLFTGGNAINSLWDLQSGRQLHEIVGPRDVTLSGAFSHDGRYLVTANGDDTVRIWDRETGQELRRMTLPFETGFVSFSNNDNFLFIHGGDGKLHILDTRVEDTLNALCSRLLRDFTPEEREQYEIMDDAPTCPQFK